MSNPIQPTEEIRLETIRWHQKLQEIIYLEAGQHMRALNQLMWQIPSFVIAVNGGLWYATTIANESSLWIIFSVLALFDVTTIVSLYRLRYLIEMKIEKQKNIEDPMNNPILSDLTSQSGFIFTAQSQPKPKSYIVVSCWTAMLVTCFAVNIFGLYSPQIFSKQPQANTYKATVKKINSEYIIEAKFEDAK